MFAMPTRSASSWASSISCPLPAPLVSVTVVVLIAALDSWGRVVGVLIFYFIYLQIENTWLTPRIMRTRVDLAGLTILIALLLGSSLAGIIGAMVAVPTAVLIAVLLEEYAVHDEDDHRGAAPRERSAPIRFDNHHRALVFPEGPAASF